MAEIRANWCQNGDKQQSILIKRNVSMYFERSYITGVFLCHSMFNPMTGMSFSATSKQAQVPIIRLESILVGMHDEEERFPPGYW